LAYPASGRARSWQVSMMSSAVRSTTYIVGPLAKLLRTPAHAFGRCAVAVAEWRLKRFGERQCADASDRTPDYIGWQRSDIALGVRTSRIFQLGTQLDAAVVSAWLRDCLPKRPAWLDHDTVLGLTFAIKTFAAAVVALYIAFWAGLEDPRWSFLTV